MKCPKCGYEQPGTKVCESCGLIFERYRKNIELREQIRSAETVEYPQKGRGLMVGIGGALVAVLIVGGVAMFRNAGVAPAASVPTPVSVQVTPAGPAQVQPDTFSGRDIASQLEASVPPQNLVEKARNATVFIQTPWGVGSGFFIDDSGTILTNKHVVVLSDEEVAELGAEIQGMKKEASLRQAMIKSNKETYQKVVSGKARIVGNQLSVNELEERIKHDDEKMEEFLQVIADAEQKLDEMKFRPEISIVLADGSLLDGSVDRVSDEHDLALVSLYGDVYSPTIPAGNSGTLGQGDQLFTVGSPLGIRHVVTSGIFSGIVEVDGKEMLQTDAPINPGNSGGPLINGAGQVVGINTLKISGAQGLGFAIPIETALQEMVLGN